MFKYYKFKNAKKSLIFSGQVNNKLKKNQSVLSELDFQDQDMQIKSNKLVSIYHDTSMSIRPRPSSFISCCHVVMLGIPSLPNSYPKNARYHVSVTNQ